MAEKTRAELKALFQNTLRPDQDDFGDLIDSFVTKSPLESDTVSNLVVGTLAITSDAFFPAGSVDPSAIDPNKIVAPLGQDLGGGLVLQYDTDTLEVVGSKLTVVNSGIPTNAVGTAQIQDGAVTSDKLVGGSVTASKIVSQAVDTSKLSDGAVTGNKIGDYAVGGAKINPSALGVGLAKNPSEQVYVKANRRIIVDGDGVSFDGPTSIPFTDNTANTTLAVSTGYPLSRSSVIKSFIKTEPTSAAVPTNVVLIITQKDSNAILPDKIYTSQEIGTIGLGRIACPEIYVPAITGYNQVDITFGRSSTGGTPVELSSYTLIDTY